MLLILKAPSYIPLGWVVGNLDRPNSLSAVRLYSLNHLSETEYQFQKS